MSNCEIRQIFYNKKTFNQIKAPFIPLDNTLGRNDWFEFWPIVKFLYNNKLKSNFFYGFFSPKFHEKTGYSVNEVIKIVDENKNHDVIIFTHTWELLSYYKNPWEQGETVHPGIIDESQKFLDFVGIKINLENFISCCKNSFFSNYVVAKKKYWDSWMKLCLSFYNYTELSTSRLNFKNTAHYSKNNYPLKVFIQERLPSILLATDSYKTINFVKNYKRISGDFVRTERNIEKIKLCDFYKEKYIFNEQKSQYLEQFEEARQKVLSEKFWFNFMVSMPLLIKKLLALVNLLSNGKLQSYYEKKKVKEYENQPVV